MVPLFSPPCTRQTRLKLPCLVIFYFSGPVLKTFFFWALLTITAIFLRGSGMLVYFGSAMPDSTDTINLYFVLKSIFQKNGLTHFPVLLVWNCKIAQSTTFPCLFFLSLEDRSHIPRSYFPPGTSVKSAPKFLAHVSYWERPRHLLTWVTEWGTDGRSKGEAMTALATKGLDVSYSSAAWIRMGKLLTCN